MTAVSQRIPSFLGGVSQQADEKLFPGQLKDALNCYPDTTLGMIKRPGGKFLGTLQNLTANSADNAAWFSVFRDDQEKYIATVSPSGAVRVWDFLTGTEKTVAYQSTSVSGIANPTTAIQSYLTATDYRSIKTLTINDFTYIINTEKTVEAKPNPTWNAKRQAVIVIAEVDYDTAFKVTINGTTYTYTSKSDYTNATPPAKIDRIALSEVVDGIFNAIGTISGVTKAKVDNTIVLTSTVDITVTSEAGPTGKYLRTFQDSVDNFTRLPEQSKHGIVVKVANTSSDKDDFYLKFVADNATSGPGVWEETRAPNVSEGLKSETMPVALIRLANGTFKVTTLDGTEVVNSLPLAWEPRLVGDDESNSHPSFVGKQIQDIFLFNNRLGFLTEDNVSMSQAGDYYNFYHVTATSQVISDPIDLSCASIKPAILNAVTPISQGLLLFSRSQQFLMESEDGSWTPGNVSIRTIANYECDKHIKPADLGATVMFVSKNVSWTRAFEIFTRGQREAPTVTESSLAVPEWIPQSITKATGSSQNSLWVGSDKSSNKLYLFRFYDQGDERKIASWVRWQLPSNVVHTDIQNDILYVVTSGSEGYSVLNHTLVLSPSSDRLVNSLGNAVDPYLDAWYEIQTTPTFNNQYTKVYIPTHYNTSKTLRYVVGLKKVNPSSELDSGLTQVVTVQSDGGGNYFEIPGDVTGHYIYIGYEYQMELTLPRYKYSAGDNGYDFTGYTTIARMQFYTGLGGSVYFSLKDRTRQDWTDTAGIQIADTYQADSSPFRDSYIYKVPVHQRPDNFTMKVISNTPFPVSIVAMQWEGQYSPGFYRKA